MIQSGTGKFKNLSIHLDGKTVTLSNTITFPKPFNNPPVIVLNVNGANFNFSANSLSLDQVGIGIVVHQLQSYELTYTKVNNKNFTANMDVVTLNFPVIEKIEIKGELIQFSWIAYDEVTIGA